MQPDRPDSVFVLRNNDIGDLLVVTPLFAALRRQFPEAAIIAGVGDWNRDVLAHNPNLDDVLPVNAPWHNQGVKEQTPLKALRYILSSPEVAALRRRRCTIGIDVLGSGYGSLLLLRAGIGWRLGVRGYAGGDAAAQQCVDFHSRVQVGRASLAFASLLGATELPSPRPQLFLTPAETAVAESTWSEIGRGHGRRRIVIGPGGGFAAKCWPVEYFSVLARMLDPGTHYDVLVVGGPKEKNSGESIVGAASGVVNLAGKTSLRETFALVAQADLVICNSSMLMHVAAAFDKPALVLLGEAFDSSTAHAALWGHENSSHVCGREEGIRRDIFRPDEALNAVRALIERNKMISGASR